MVGVKQGGGANILYSLSIPPLLINYNHVTLKKKKKEESIKEKHLVNELMLPATIDALCSNLG